MANGLEADVFAQEQWALSGALLELATEGDFALVRQIVDVFLTDTQAKVESLRWAVFPADFAEARRIAHSLKGAARQVGTSRLASAAERLERCAPKTDEATFALLVMGIRKSWSEAERAVIDGLTLMPGKLA